MSMTYILKNRNLGQSLETYVAGSHRFNFFKRPVVEKEEDSSPIIYEKTITIDHNQENNIIMKDKRSIGCQTLFRESEAQTVPAPLGEIERDGTFLEILELKEFSYGNGLPASMYEIELIAKAREKRAFNDALPPLSDEACFHLRSRLTKEQEFREWTQLEKELKDINDQRLMTLQQMLLDRERDLEEKRISKIEELKGKKDEEVEAQIIYSKKRRVKIIRSIEKSKENFNKKDKFKRDVIMDYASFGSKVYAPLTRDGHNPDRHPFKLQYVSDYLTSYEGLIYLENKVTQAQLVDKLDIDQISKEYNNKLRKGEKVHVKAIDDAFASIKNQEKKILEEKLSLEKKADDSKNKVEKPKVAEKKAEDFEEIILFQRLLRGRKEQNLMHEGKSKRAELIKELRSADFYKQAGATDEENKMLDNYVEKLMNGVVDAIQGQNISQTLDFLSKELIRKKEEMKINAIVNMAEDERRRREAEEMGRRQAEELLRDRQEVLYKELLNVNQGTMDSYLNSIFAGTVNNVSKKQVMREIEIKAVKLNKIVDKLENEFISDDVTVRDLVSSFIIPEIYRKKEEDKVENEEKRFIETSKNSIQSSLNLIKRELQNVQTQTKSSQRQDSESG